MSRKTKTSSIFFRKKNVEIWRYGEEGKICFYDTSAKDTKVMCHRHRDYREKSKLKVKHEKRFKFAVLRRLFG